MSATPSGVRPPPLTAYPLDQIPETLTGGVVAVGNFDGVHGGHRALLAAARAEATARGVPAVVLTFEPHPRTFFRPETPVFRLTPLPAKARLLRALGIDGLVVVNFDRAFAAKPAAAFVEEILIGRLKLAAAVVGFNFHFGKGRGGSPALLAEAGERGGFPVTIVGAVDDAGSGAAVSSSAIRENLAAGDIAAANARLGYRWFVVETVVPGDRRGRELGYPTANLRLEPDCRLRHGIYAVRMQRADGSLLDGVASYGRRPTFDNGAAILEVHVFDFGGDLYGETLSVAFVGWIRPELKFPSVATLTVAMDGDAEAAHAMLAEAGPGSALDRVLAGLA
jgi:riboflavin kinase / FMN adenylyltransferase